MIAYTQKFKFIFGIKLSVVLYYKVDKIAKNMQDNKVSISNTMQFDKWLVKTLEEKQVDFHEFWDNVQKSRTDFNRKARDIDIWLQYGPFDEIEEPKCPRLSIINLIVVAYTEEGVIQTYWRKFHIGAFIFIL